MAGGGFSGSSQRRLAVAQAEQQRAELAQQKADAQDAQAAGMQDTLEAETNRLLRTYQTRALLAGGRVAGR